MRIRSAAIATAAVASVCAAGPALAAVAGSADQTTTITQTTTTTQPTTTTETTTTPAKPVDVCLATGRRALARSLGVSSARIRIRLWLGGNDMPQCSFVVARAHRGGPHDRVRVTVNVDSAPQAAWRLMRTVVEASQLFGPAPPGWHAPIGLMGLGPYASWFIKLHSLMAVNHTRTQLLTATVSWRRATRAEMIRLARSVIVAYIHAPAKAQPIPVSAV